MKNTHFESDLILSKKIEIIPKNIRINYIKNLILRKKIQIIPKIIRINFIKNLILRKKMKFYQNLRLNYVKKPMAKVAMI